MAQPREDDAKVICSRRITATLKGAAIAGDTDGLKLSVEELAGLLSVQNVAKAAGTDKGTVSPSLLAAGSIFDYLAPDQSVNLTYSQRAPRRSTSR